MRRFVVAMAVMIVAPAGILLAQQKYPNVTEAPVLLENDRVIVQRNEFEVGAWVGGHSHAGNQLVVALEDMELVYKEGDKETTRSYKAGDVFWVDAAQHDHKSLTGGAGILITLK